MLITQRISNPFGYMSGRMLELANTLLLTPLQSKEVGSLGDTNHPNDNRYASEMILALFPAERLLPIFTGPSVVQAAVVICLLGG